MDSLAFIIIKKNKETKDPFLDLGNCGLKGNEPELEMLRECEHLETIIFSNSKPKINSNKRHLENERTINQGYDNILIQIPNSLPINLKELYLHGNELKPWRFSDISVLQKLTKLKVLTLWGENISDISHLARLKELESLKLRSRKISDISSISNLSNLTSLEININETLTLDTLSTLVNLKSLTLFVEKVNSLNPIKDLINLESLHIFSNEITDLSFVGPLENLKSLKFGGERILDISSIRNLKNLETLDFWGYRIKDLSEISSLKSLIRLEIVPTKIVDILNVSIHSIPSQNEVLNIWKKNIEVSFKKSNPKESSINIENLTFPFRNLTEIKILNLSYNLISDLSQLGSLSKLEILKLSHNQIKNISSKDLELFQDLKEIELDGNPIQNIPREIFNQWGNVLPQVKAYLEDSGKGSFQNQEVKVILIGNGSVGKTQFAKKLSEKDAYIFEEEHQSTPGISLLQSHLYSNFYQSDLILNLWDFGGQDLYHATHRMFMRSRALIVLVWDLENENKGSHEWKGKSYRNHRIRYWLAYSHLFAPNRPVLVLESKVDNESAFGTLREKEKKLLKKEFPNIVGFVFGSAKTGNKIDAIESKILNVLENNPMFHDEIFKAKLPTSWITVRDQIRKLQQSQEPVKELRKEEFQGLCRNEDIEATTDTLLGFLHDTGVLYYQNNLFNNKIILDQAWAITAVYELFNRSNAYAELLRMENRYILTYQDIKKIWPKNSDPERELFMGFLVDAELCFVEDGNSHGNFSDRIFSVPQLLSEKRPDSIDFYINHEGLIKDNPKLYKLIPSSFIYRFIVRVQQIAEVNDLWQYGIYFTLNGVNAIVEINDSEDELFIYYSPQEEDIREFILNEFEKIKENISFDMGEGERDNVREMIKWGFEKYRKDDKKYKNNLVNSNQPNYSNMEKKGIEIFMSYAWGDSNEQGENREKIVDELYESLINDGFEVIRDKVDLGYKSLISEFMQKIGKSDCIVVVISDKYLKSPYCMFELLEIYRKSNSDISQMREKLIPIVLDDAKIYDPEHRLDYIAYWKKKKEDLDKKVAVVGLEYAVDVVDDFKIYREITSNIGLLAGLLKDLNSLNPKELSKNNFEIIKREIENRWEC